MEPRNDDKEIRKARRFIWVFRPRARRPRRPAATPADGTPAGSLWAGMRVMRWLIIRPSTHQRVATSVHRDDWP